MISNGSMSKLETAVQSLSCGDADKACSDMLLACNTFGLGINDFLNLVIERKPKVRKVWTDIAWHWVKCLDGAYNNNSYDGRNKFSCRIGHNIYSASGYGEEALPDLPFDDFVTMFVGRMAVEHRTLQQSFSSLTFAWLDYLAEEKSERRARRAIEAVKMEYGDKWYRMPMI